MLMHALFLRTLIWYVVVRAAVQQEPRFVQLLSVPYLGMITLRGGPAQFGVSLKNHPGVSNTAKMALFSKSFSIATSGITFIIRSSDSLIFQICLKTFIKRSMTELFIIVFLLSFSTCIHICFFLVCLLL